MKSKDLANADLRLSGLSRVWDEPSPFELIEQTELPNSIKQVVHGVVKRSRLWRQEKMEVAIELLAHFEDGLRSGKEAEKLIHDFGDPQVAAQLIRSGKIRNRSMNTKLLYGGFWGVFAFIVSYFGLTAFYHAGKANPNHDYFADFNEPALTVAPEDAAWPIYRPAFTKFSFSEGGNGKFEEIYVKLGDGIELATPQDREVWKTAINKLEQSSELLDAFRAARLKSYLGLPLYADQSRYSDEDFAALFPNRTREVKAQSPSSTLGVEIMERSMIGILLPHYQVLRKAARILIVDSRWAIEQEDFERVTQNVESLFGFSRQLGNESILVGDLVGFAIQSIGFDLIDELLPKYVDRFSDDQLARLQTAVTDSDPAEMIDLDGEKYMALDILQRCFTDDGSDDGRITAEGYEIFVRNFETLFNSTSQDESSLPQTLANTWKSVAAPVAMMQFPSRKQVEEEYVSLLQERQQEMQKRCYADAAFKSNEAPQLESNPFLKSLFPAIQQVATTMFRTKGQQEATATALALYRHQKKTGHLPNALGDLLSTYLEKLPTDQFDGKPLRYQKKDDGSFILYSIGFDRTDNNGQRKLMSAESASDRSPQDVPQPTGQFQMSGEDKDIDWVLWPRMGKNSN